MVKDESDTGEVAPNETTLWERLRSKQDMAARDQLVERYLQTAQKIAASLYAKRPDNSIDFSDYLQYARVGLLEAIDRYDPGREAQFATFATYRIRGAVLNGIEHSTEISTQKAQRRRIRRERLKSIHEQTGASDDPFLRMLDLTLGLAIGYLLEESGVWKPGEADRASDPYQTLELRRLSERMALLVGALPEREREIVRHHYFEHKEFIEIAKALGISKGRVSQLHSRALRLLREGYHELNRLNRSV